MRLAFTASNRSRIVPHRPLPPAALILLILTGCGRAAPPPPAGPPLPIAAPPATADAIPAGTVLRLQLNQTVSERLNDVGDRFTATALDALIARDGDAVIPAGAIAGGEIRGFAEPGARPAGQPAVLLDVDRLTIRDRVLPLTGVIIGIDGDSPDPLVIPAGAVLRYQLTETVPLRVP